MATHSHSGVAAGAAAPISRLRYSNWRSIRGHESWCEKTINSKLSCCASSTNASMQLSVEIESRAVKILRFPMKVTEEQSNLLRWDQQCSLNSCAARQSDAGGWSLCYSRCITRRATIDCRICRACPFSIHREMQRLL